MPYCPNCRIEYVSGADVCAECGQDLVEQLDEVADLDFVELYACANRMEADKLQSILAEEGIVSNLRSLESSSFPTSAGIMGDVHLVVDSRLLEEARKLIEQAVSTHELSEGGEFLEG